MEIGERIKTLRKELKLTQAEFGEKIDVKGGVVSAWEKGTANIPYGRVLMICEQYDVNEKWLSSGVGEKFQQKTSSRTSQDDVETFIFTLLDQVPGETRQKALSLCRAVLARYA